MYCLNTLENVVIFGWPLNILDALKLNLTVNLKPESTQYL